MRRTVFLPTGMLALVVARTPAKAGNTVRYEPNWDSLRDIPVPALGEQYEKWIGKAFE